MEVVPWKKGTGYVAPLFEACAEFQTRIGLRLIDLGVDAIWFGDDFGTQSSLIIPPEIFRNQLKPIYKQMIDRFKVKLFIELCRKHGDIYH